MGGNSQFSHEVTGVKEALFDFHIKKQMGSNSAVLLHKVTDRK